jgi:hypothetical protein
MFLLKYKGLLAMKGTHLMLINQQRYKINFAGPTVLDAAGGNPIRFYPDLKVKMTKKRDIKNKDKIVGTDVDVTATKNKFSLPFVKYTISIMFGKGISNLRACSFLLQDEGKVIQSGSFFIVNLIGEEKTLRGRIELEKYLFEHQDKVVDYLKKKGHL